MLEQISYNEEVEQLIKVEKTWKHSGNDKSVILK